jgi:uncharacterized GH25 family protein
MRRTLLFAFFLLPFTFLPAFGQSGGIKGKLKNMNGDGIPNATVTARQNSKDIASTTSTSKGTFVLTGLKEGTYNVVFDAKGYASGVKFGVEVKDGKTRDLGGNLILMTDRGSQVHIQGSVFYKDGTSVSGADVKIERVNSDGSTTKIRTVYTNEVGEFTFRQPDGAKTFRITATHRGSSASKDLVIEEANVYRMAISLDINRSQE